MVSRGHFSRGHLYEAYIHASTLANCLPKQPKSYQEGTEYREEGNLALYKLEAGNSPAWYLSEAQSIMSGLHARFFTNFYTGKSHAQLSRKEPCIIGTIHATLTAGVDGRGAGEVDSNVTVACSSKSSFMSYLIG
ncbi:hypothetical protein RJZ56_007684 [Blastomyces dermatitidis]